jgi:hypothetical protein
VTEPVRFIVTLEGIRDSRRLQQRNFVRLAGGGLIAVGVGLWLVTGHPAAIAAVVFATLIFLEWRFPVFDSWFDRHRLVLGSECEVWADESGIRYRQGATGTFESSGVIDWSRISEVREDDRALLVMDGRQTLVAIPKGAVSAPESLARFAAEIRGRISKRKLGTPPPK